MAGNNVQKRNQGNADIPVVDVVAAVQDQNQENVVPKCAIFDQKFTPRTTIATPNVTSIDWDAYVWKKAPNDETNVCLFKISH